MSSEDHNHSSSRPKPNWTAIFVYYAIACGISWPFFWWSFFHTESWNGSAIPVWIRPMSFMWGPGIAALVCLAFFRKTHQRTITFWGTSKMLSAGFYLLPTLLLTLAHPPAARFLIGTVGNPDAYQVTPVMFVWTFGLAFCRTLGEELGWRGFLQDALRPLRFVPRFVSLGVLWEFWHIIVRTANHPFSKVAIILAISYPAVILVSIIIGIAVERSRSICVAVSLHAWTNLAFRLHSEGTFVVLGISILLWIFLLWRWPQPAKNPASTAVPITNDC